MASMDTVSGNHKWSNDQYIVAWGQTVNQAKKQERRKARRIKWTFIGLAILWVLWAAAYTYMVNR